MGKIIKTQFSRFHFKVSAFHFKNLKGDFFFYDTTTTNIHSIPFFSSLFGPILCAFKGSPVSLLWWALLCPLGETVIRSLDFKFVSFRSKKASLCRQKLQGSRKESTSYSLECYPGRNKQPLTAFSNWLEWWISLTFEKRSCKDTMWIILVNLSSTSLFCK